MTRGTFRGLTGSVAAMEKTKANERTETMDVILDMKQWEVGWVREQRKPLRPADCFQALRISHFFRSAEKM